MALAGRLVILAVGLGLPGWLIVHQLAAGRRDTPYQRSRLFVGMRDRCAVRHHLLLICPLSGEIAGIRTKTDILYFTVTVPTTVGFGDIRAVGQIARGSRRSPDGFDVLFVATAAPRCGHRESSRRTLRG